MASRFAVVALLALGCSEHPPLEVAKVDLERFQGGWYEIAKLPRATQSSCTGTTAYYRLKSPTELDVYNECREGGLDGPLKRVAARGVVTDPAEPAKLSVDFGGFFGDFWIVERDGDYRFAAVGHPSRDYLWILSRTPSMDEAELEALLERLRQKDFEVARLERTLQAEGNEIAPPAADQLPSPNDHGCSFATPRHRTSSGLAWFALLVLAGFVTRLERRSSQSN